MNRRDPSPCQRGAAGEVSAATGTDFGTNNHSAATPSIANTKLVTHTASNWPGRAASNRKATIGPSNEPQASMARCTEKALAKERPGVLNEISASRGAARIPLPSRSTPTTSRIQA
jgi:hypothetical protein